MYATTDLWGLLTGAKSNYAYKNRIISYGKTIISLSKKSLELKIELDLHADIGRYVLFDPLSVARIIIFNFHADLRTTEPNEDQYDQFVKNLEVFTNSVYIMLDNLQIEDSQVSVSDTIASVYSILKELSSANTLKIKDYQNFIIILDRLLHQNTYAADPIDYIKQTIHVLANGINKDYLRRALSELISEGTHIYTLNILLTLIKKHNIDLSNQYISTLISKPFMSTRLHTYNQTPEFYSWLINLFNISDHGSFITAWKMLDKVVNVGSFAKKVIERFRPDIEESYNISYLVDAIDIPINSKPIVIKKLLSYLSNYMIAAYVEDLAMDLFLMPTIHKCLAAEMVTTITYMDEDKIKSNIINKYMSMFSHYAMAETKEAILGLESLELPALITYLILKELSIFADTLPMYVMWNKITRVKHRDQSVPIDDKKRISPAPSDSVNAKKTRR